MHVKTKCINLTKPAYYYSSLSSPAEACYSWLPGYSYSYDIPWSSQATYPGATFLRNHSLRSEPFHSLGAEKLCKSLASPRLNRYISSLSHVH